jgi:hypothetical protein
VRAHSIDGGVRTARWHDEGDGTTAYRRSQRRQRPDGEVVGGAARAARRRPARWRRMWPVGVGGVARQTRAVGSGQWWSVVRMARQLAARCRNTAWRRCGREAAVGTPACGPDSTFKARRVAWHGRVAAMRRRCAVRWAWRGKHRLIGGPLMSVISGLKFTPIRK